MPTTPSHPVFPAPLFLTYSRLQALDNTFLFLEGSMRYFSAWLSTLKSFEPRIYFLPVHRDAEKYVIKRFYWFCLLYILHWSCLILPWHYNSMFQCGLYRRILFSGAYCQTSFIVTHTCIFFFKSSNLLPF